jgi:NDP-sugar pyrophosphorylase family protein
MSEQIQFRRTYDSMFERGRISYAIFRGKKFTIPKLMIHFEYTDQPIEAEVEAQWGGSRRPDRLKFCDASYDFTPRNGQIIAQATTSTAGSKFSWGTVIHPDVTVRDSEVGKLTEISNDSRILNSRVGNGCLIGAGVVVTGCRVYDNTELQDGAEFHSPLLEATGRDFKELALEGAKW